VKANKYIQNTKYKRVERTYLIIADLTRRVRAQDLENPGGIGGRQPEISEQADEKAHRHEVEGEVGEEAQRQAGRQVQGRPARPAHARVPEEEGHRPLHVCSLWKAKQATTTFEENFICRHAQKQKLMLWTTKRRLQLTEGMLSWWRLGT